LKHHLDGGIRKGALTQEQADAKLAAWLEAKNGTVDAKKDGLSKQADAKAKAFKAEQVNAKRLAAAAQAEADAIAAATPAVEEEVAEVEAEEAPAAEENNEETQA
jgi:small subunit ribosomal protein S16